MKQNDKLGEMTKAEIERRAGQGPNADFAGPHVMDSPAAVDTTEPEPANQGSQGSKPKPPKQD